MNVLLSLLNSIVVSVLCGEGTGSFYCGSDVHRQTLPFILLQERPAGHEGLRFTTEGDLVLSLL